MKRLLITVLIAGALTGCADDLPVAAPTPTATATTTQAGPTPTATGSKECRELAAAVLVARLAGPRPTEEVAKVVAGDLDARLSRLSPKVHEPAVDLHGHLHDLEDALRLGRNERADLMFERSKADARAAAKACSMPDEAFLGAP